MIFLRSPALRKKQRSFLNRRSQRSQRVTVFKSSTFNVQRSRTGRFGEVLYCAKQIPGFTPGLARKMCLAPGPGMPQLRTEDNSRYPSKANSIAWIANISYIPGAGSQQQLDLYLPTNQKNMPLTVYVHGGGFAHGDKFGDSLNPNELQLLWDGYAMASINFA
jgi:hypothetical protein